MKQYTGARYVPTYYQNSLDPTSSEWEANVQYDPLTIVSLPNLHSYQSKKFVPANIGSPASNPEYWYDQGYANAYCQALQDQIDDMKDGTVPGSLQEQIDTNTSDITALTNFITNRYFIFQGDSYSLQNTYGFDTWPKRVANYMGLTNDNYTILANDGGGFVDTGHEGTFKSQLQNNPINKAVTDIVICAGANDRLYTGIQIQNAISDYIAEAKTMYGNDVRIHIAMIGWSTTQETALQILNVSYPAYKDGAIRYGAHWLECPTSALLFASDFYDNLHPNGTGQIKIAYSIYEALNGNYADNFFEYTAHATAYTGFTISPFDVHISQHVEFMNIKGESALNYWKINKTTPSSFTRNFQTVATLDESIYAGAYITFDVAGVLAIDDSTFYTIPMTVRIIDNQIQISTIFDTENTSSYILLPLFNATVPTRSN